MKTAVDYLIQELFTVHDENFDFNPVFEKAKEIEKQQIGKAFLNGRLKEIGTGVLFDLQPLAETFDNYYNETFK
jgi:hypothetical protein